MNALASVQTTHQENAVIATLAGEVDLSNVQSLRDQLLAAIPDSAPALIVDLSEIAYCDSQGITMLLTVACRMKARGQYLGIVIPIKRSPLLRLFKLIPECRPLPVHRSIGEAIRQITTPKQSASRRHRVHGANPHVARRGSLRPGA